ncbi:KilA-N domain-containing protein [Cohaesibacter gelatinilyticus]|nr:KilA-N domain-containing protein [Cohaesibacter gelatinilyticus]
MTELVSHAFNRTHIQQRPDDGYLSATAMCKATGKLWGNYYQNDTTKAYLSALAGSIGIPIDRLVVKIMKGPNDQRGTWVHPKVAIHLAQWLSPEFAVWCTNIIHDWMEGKRVVVKEHRRKAPARKLPDPYTFASNIPVADLLYSAQGHLNDALRTKSTTKAEWHTRVAAGCVGAMLDNMGETGLHVLHRQLASQQQTIKQMKGKV